MWTGDNGLSYGFAHPASDGEDRGVATSRLAPMTQLVFEFARKGYDDLSLFKRNPTPFTLGIGVVDVKSREVETVDLISARIRRA